MFLPWSAAEHSTGHHQRLQSILRVHLLPHFGKTRIAEIYPRAIEEYKATRRGDRFKKGSRQRSKPVGVGTINREICCLKVIFRKAVEWGVIKECPTDRVKTLRETPRATKLLTRDQVARLMEALPDRLKALGACAVYAGLRRSELFHLRRQDIDWETHELTVASTAEHHTKNYQSRRIPMDTPLLEALRRQPITLHSAYLFCNRWGKPYDNVRKALNVAAEVAGIDGGVTLHQLRHAFCSHALMSGIDPRTVQKWMGHSDLKTTLKYAHVSPDHERAAIRKLRYDHGHYVDTKVG